MKIIEQFSISKTGKASDCEDIIFYNDNFAAVIDGATARDSRLYNGKKSGLTAAIIAEDALKCLDEEASLRETLDIITEGFLKFYKENDIDLLDINRLIAASAVIYSRFHNQIWMIGDCQCMIGGKAYSNPNGIDDYVAGIRSFINQAEIVNGHTVEWIMDNDPGSKHIHELLVNQFLFQNCIPLRKGSFSYTALDGRYIETEAVKVIQLDHNVNELILASDGYPVLASTLSKSEEMLSKTLENDPLCIYENRCVKGIKPGLVSFDDRAYLNLNSDNK